MSVSKKSSVEQSELEKKAASDGKTNYMEMFVFLKILRTKGLPNYIMNDATTWFLAWNLLVYFFSLKHLLTQFYLYWFAILVLLTNLISIIFFFETYKNCGLEMLCKNTPRSLTYKDSNNNKKPDRNFFTEHLRRLSGTGVYVLILQKF